MFYYFIPKLRIQLFDLASNTSANFNMNPLKIEGIGF